MDDRQSTPNPFASPAAATTTAIAEFDPDSEMREFHFGKSLFKWLLICGISSVPSFMIAFPSGSHATIRIAAMVCGILTFVAGYVWVESREWTRRKLMNKSLRIAVKTGYISRIVITVLFPIGFVLDMICGMISVGLVSEVFGQDLIGGGMIYDESVMPSMPFAFAWYYTTTLLQGLMLNIVLGAYMLIVFAIVLFFRNGNKS